LIRQASDLESADIHLRSLLTESKLKAIVDAVPGSWLTSDHSGETTGEKRNVYVNFLLNRLNHSEIFVKEAAHARKSFV
jgi:hypothetical protein